MTAEDICRIALSYLSQTPEESEDLMALSPLWLSTLIAESLYAENNIRRRLGEEELKKAPVVTAETMQEPLPLQEELCRIALPYGLASFYYMDDDNDFRSADFKGRYLAALDEAVTFEEEEIRDAYKDGDD